MRINLKISTILAVLVLQLMLLSPTLAQEVTNLLQLHTGKSYILDFPVRVTRVVGGDPSAIELNLFKKEEMPGQPQGYQLLVVPIAEKNTNIIIWTDLGLYVFDVIIDNSASLTAETITYVPKTKKFVVPLTEVGQKKLLEKPSSPQIVEIDVTTQGEEVPVEDIRVETPEPPPEKEKPSLKQEKQPIEKPKTNAPPKKKPNLGKMTSEEEDKILQELSSLGSEPLENPNQATPPHEEESETVEIDITVMEGETAEETPIVVEPEEPEIKISETNKQGTQFTPPQNIPPETTENIIIEEEEPPIAAKPSPLPQIEEIEQPKERPIEIQPPSHTTKPLEIKPSPVYTPEETIILSEESSTEAPPLSTKEIPLDEPSEIIPTEEPYPSLTREELTEQPKTPYSSPLEGPPEEPSVVLDAPPKSQQVITIDEPPKPVDPEPIDKEALVKTLALDFKPRASTSKIQKTDDAICVRKVDNNTKAVMNNNNADLVDSPADLSVKINAVANEEGFLLVDMTVNNFSSNTIKPDWSRLTAHGENNTSLKVVNQSLQVNFLEPNQRVRGSIALVPPYGRSISEMAPFFVTVFDHQGNILTKIRIPLKNN